MFPFLDEAGSSQCYPSAFTAASRRSRGACTVLSVEEISDSGLRSVRTEQGDAGGGGGGGQNFSRGGGSKNPASMDLMISSVDCWNAFSSELCHLNLVFGDNTGLNGVMSAVNYA